VFETSFLLNKFLIRQVINQLVHPVKHTQITKWFLTLNQIT